MSGRKRCITNRDKYTPMHVNIEGKYVMFIYYIYLYMKSSFPKRDKRQIKKKWVRHAILLCTEPIHCSINVSCQIAIFPCLKCTARCSSMSPWYHMLHVLFFFFWHKPTFKKKKGWICSVLKKKLKNFAFIIDNIVVSFNNHCLTCSDWANRPF